MSMLANIFRKIVNLLPAVEIAVKADVEVDVTVGAPVPPPPSPARMLEQVLDDKAARLKQEGGDNLTGWRLSVVDLFKLVDEESSFSHRKQFAADLGMANYKGTANDNIELSRRFLDWLRAH